MTLTGEFRVSVSDFPLETALTAVPDAGIRLVRVTMAPGALSPFFWASCTVSPMVNDRFHGYSVLSRDITSRKQCERMLERQNDRLKEFTDSLSHDLRNPLNVVDARIGLYRQTGDGTHLDTAETHTRRMERLIDGLLAVARQEDVVRDPSRLVRSEHPDSKPAVTRTPLARRSDRRLCGDIPVCRQSHRKCVVPMRHAF